MQAKAKKVSDNIKKKEVKKKRVMTQAQKDGLAKGRAKALEKLS